MSSVSFAIFLVAVAIVLAAVILGEKLEEIADALRGDDD